MFVTGCVIAVAVERVYPQLYISIWKSGRRRGRLQPLAFVRILTRDRVNWLTFPMSLIRKSLQTKGFKTLISYYKNPSSKLTTS